MIYVDGDRPKPPVLGRAVPVLIKPDGAAILDDDAIEPVPVGRAVVVH